MTALLDHWIVAGSRSASTGGIGYRRFQLAKYLRDRADTRSVFWVCFRRRQRARVVVEELPNGLSEVVLRDPLDLLRYLPSVPVPSGLRALFRDERALWFTHPSCPALAREPGWRSIVYDCSDLWSAPWDDRRHASRPAEWAERARRRAMTRAEREIVARATRVVATVPALDEQLQARYGRAADEIIDNGVDYDRFAAAIEPAVDPRRPWLVYAGGLKPSVDFDLIGMLADAVPEADVVLLGPVSSHCRADVDRIIRRPNVRHLDAVEAERVPNVLCSASIGLLPYRETAWTAAASPLKLFEYLAAGIPAVGIGVPATAAYDEPGAYRHASSRVAFIEECRRLLHVTESVRAAERRRAIASAHDWGRKFDAMAKGVIR